MVKPLFELGKPDVLEWAFPLLTGKPRHIIRDAAMGLAKGGHLTYLESLHNHKLFFQLFPLLPPAASEGHIHILEWLNDNNYWLENKVNTQAMAVACRLAAKNGHKDVILWFHYHTHIDTATAFLGAAEGGQLPLLEWLFLNTDVIFVRYTKAEMSKAAAKGNQLHILKWLESKGLVLDCKSAYGAAEGGHLELLHYLYLKVL